MTNIEKIESECKEDIQKIVQRHFKRRAIRCASVCRNYFTIELNWGYVEFHYNNEYTFRLEPKIFNHNKVGEICDSSKIFYKVVGELYNNDSLLNKIKKRFLKFKTPADEMVENNTYFKEYVEL